MHRRLLIVVSLAGLWSSRAVAYQNPIKVYILAGQSNMQGKLVI